MLLNVNFHTLGAERKITGGTFAKVRNYLCGMKCTRCLYFFSVALQVLLAADGGEGRCSIISSGLIRDCFNTFHSNYTCLLQCLCSV